MKCKKCGNRLNVVKTVTIGDNIYRTRVCFNCNYTFQTAETMWKEISESKSTTEIQNHAENIETA